MKFVKGLTGIAAALLCIPWSSFVLTKLWAWFVVPLHVQALSVWHAAGLAVAVRFLVLPADRARDKDNEGFGFALARALGYPAIMLGLGALYWWLAS